MATQKDLEYYLAQVRRIAEHREVGVEKEIRKEYRTLLKDLQHFIGDEYAKLAENDQLTYAILQQKSDYARFLEEVEGIINTNSPNISQKVQNLVQEMYALSYQGMITAVDRASDSEELKEALKGVRGVTPEIVKRAVENPVAGLTLNDILEKKRKEVIYEIKQQIGIGLTNGDRYSTMAKRIAERVDMDYRKAMTIVRTESHRVQEAGYHDSATELNKTLNAGTTTKRLQKTWRTMRDERVRKTSKANHRKLDGVSIPLDEKFDLGHGVKAEAPSQSGDPHNDINCRCYLSYDLVEVKADKPQKNKNASLKEKIGSYREQFKNEYETPINSSIPEYRRYNPDKGDTSSSDNFMKRWRGEENQAEKEEAYKFLLERGHSKEELDKLFNVEEGFDRLSISQRTDIHQMLSETDEWFISDDMLKPQADARKLNIVQKAGKEMLGSIKDDITSITDKYRKLKDDNDAVVEKYSDLISKYRDEFEGYYDKYDELDNEYWRLESKLSNNEISEKEYKEKQSKILQQQKELQNKMDIAQKKANEAEEEWKKSLDVARKVEREETEKLRSVMADKVAEIREVGTDKDLDDYFIQAEAEVQTTSGLTGTEYQNKKMVETVQTALQKYPKEWVEASLSRGKLTVGKVNRGYYNDEENILMLSQRSIDNLPYSVAFHELGHRFEYAVPRIREMEAIFYSKRTKGEALRKLSDITGSSAYAWYEQAREDNFLSPYMGKDYGGKAYELVSMGFENLFTNPEYLMKDEDYLEFILGVIALA